MTKKIFKFETNKSVFEEIEHAKAQMDSATNRELVLKLIDRRAKEGALDRVDRTVLQDEI